MRNDKKSEKNFIYKIKISNNPNILFINNLVLNIYVNWVDKISISIIGN